LIGLTILPSGVTFHPPRPSTFSGVTRDMSSACVPPARLRRFLGGSAALLRSRSSLLDVLDYKHIFHADKEQKKTNRSAKSGLASPILNFAPFHVDPLNKFKPTSSHQSQTYKINEKTHILLALERWSLSSHIQISWVGLPHLGARIRRGI